MAFTYSNGSRQLSHRNSALHAVAPNAAVRVVSAEPQRGHATSSRRVPARVSGTGPERAGAAWGGAMPAADSLRRPSAGVQSLLQAGAGAVRTSTSAEPGAGSRGRRAWGISRNAGQPQEGRGIVTTPRLPPAPTPRTVARSAP